MHLNSKITCPEMLFGAILEFHNYADKRISNCSHVPYNSWDASVGTANQMMCLLTYIVREWTMKKKLLSED